MDNEVKTEEIKKIKVFSRWVIFHSITLLIAFFSYAFLDPLNDEIIQMEGSGKIWGALGEFLVMMFIPWLIALIHRLFKKRSSTPLLFGFYYFILFLWFIYCVSWGIMLYKGLNINFWSKFENQNNIAAFVFAPFILIIFYFFRWLVVKAINIQPVEVVVTPNPAVVDKDFDIRIKKRKRKLFYFLGFAVFIVAIYFIISLLQTIRT